MAVISRWLVVALGVTTLATPLHADDWNRTLKGEFRSDVSTWARDVPGQTLQAFRGRVEVPYTMLEVLAVLADVDNFPKWVFQCDRAIHLRDAGDDLIYIRIRGIWPAEDRDVVTRSQVRQDPQSLAITIHSRADNSFYPEQGKTVRMPEFENLFILEPRRDGWTRVTFQTFANPGGALPDWLANMVATDAPRDTLTALQKQLKNKRYHIRDISELPFTLPGAESMVFNQPNPRGRLRY